MDQVLGMLKAILAALIAFVGGLAVALVGDTSFSELTDGQWVAAVLAGLVALGGVWGIPNKQA